MATTITRESAGVITLDIDGTPIYIINPENVTVKQAYGTTIIIDVLGIQQFEIVYADLTLINGGAAPGTIALATAAIAKTVFNT